ncbi:hypothetical protein KP509_31G036000 [Ceratopteris richardii]|nr:hypothetical protein KP509_31G036000 [Ceratopteris richardii]
MDAGAGEAFHFLGGLSSLLAFGPRAICSLEDASVRDAEVRMCEAANVVVEKVLVITTHLLSYVHHYIHRCLQAHSFIKVLTVLTSVSEEAHSVHPDCRLGTDAFHEYKRWLIEDHQLLSRKIDAGQASSQNLVQEVHGQTVQHPDKRDFSNLLRKERAEPDEDIEDLNVSLIIKIKHFPMIMCPLTSSAFVFPSNGLIARAPLAEGDSLIGIGLPDTTGRIRHDDDGIPIGGSLSADFLHHLAGQLGLKFDVYTLGPLSSEIGRHLTQLSGLADVSVRSRKPAGLLLVDRSLDLITPSSHSDSLMDRVFSFASRVNNQCNNSSGMLKSKTKSVSRPALDIRIPIATGEVQEVSMIDFLNKEAEMGQAYGYMNSGNDLDDCKSTIWTFSFLHSFGGSLFDGIGNCENKYLDLLLEGRVHDSLMTVEKWLMEAVSLQNMEPSRVGPKAIQRLQSLRYKLSQNLTEEVKHADLIQVSKMVEMALDPVLSTKWEGLLNAEKVLLMTVNDASQSIASQICDVVYRSGRREKSKDQELSPSPVQKLFTLEDALSLAIFGYALAGYSLRGSFSEGPFSRGEEEQLKQAIVDAISQSSNEEFGFLQEREDSFIPRQQNSSGISTTLDSHQTEQVLESSDQEIQFDFNNDGWEAWDEDDDVDANKGEVKEAEYGRIQAQLQVRDMVNAVFKRLHEVSQAGKYLQSKDKASAFDNYDGLGVSSSARRSLIFKLLMLILAKAEIPGIEHHSSFVGRIFGRIGLKQAKPKLSDSKIIMIFVVGGITGLEVCEVKEAQKIYKLEDERDIIIGGTTFLTPKDTFNILIGSCSNT